MLSLVQAMTGRAIALSDLTGEGVPTPGEDANPLNRIAADAAGHAAGRRAPDRSVRR